MGVQREGTYVYLRLIHGFDPWSGILRSCMLLGMAKKTSKKLKMYIKTSILDKMKKSLLQQIIEMYLGHVFLSSSRLHWQEAQLHHSLREKLSSNFVLWAQSHTASGPTGIRTGT